MTAEIGTDIKKAAALLRAGEVVAIPTETVYGLAANALNESAVKKIFRTKNRPFFNPLIIHGASLDSLKPYIQDLYPQAEVLAAHAWPGPLTMVLPRTDRVPDLITASYPTVALRVPRHPLTLQLLQSLSFPLAAPSANPFGYISPTTAQHVFDQLGDKIAYILDGGPAGVGVESTIVRVEQERVTLLRPGGCPREAIESWIGPIQVPGVTENERPDSPGQLKSHYAPSKRLIFGKVADLLAMNLEAKENTWVLSFSTYYEGFPKERQRLLSLSGNLDEAARNLFLAMRELDTFPGKLIVAEEFPDEEIGVAINDRLRRAAADPL